MKDLSYPSLGGKRLFFRVLTLVRQLPGLTAIARIDIQLRADELFGSALPRTLQYHLRILDRTVADGFWHIT